MHTHSIVFHTTYIEVHMGMLCFIRCTNICQCIPICEGLGHTRDIETHIGIHACVHTFTRALRNINGYRHTCLHVHIHIYACEKKTGAWIRERHTPKHVYTHAQRSGIQQETKTCLNTYIHIWMYTDVQMVWRTQGDKHSYKSTNTGTQMHKGIGMHLLSHTHLFTCIHECAQIHMWGLWYTREHGHSHKYVYMHVHTYIRVLGNIRGHRHTGIHAHMIEGIGIC